MNIEVEVGDLVERKADDRGRINLGTEYGGKKVTVAVVDVEDTDD